MRPVTQHSAEPARAFHESTKLSYINLGNKPPLYKSYPGVPTIPLPTVKLDLEAAALPAVAGTVGAAEEPFSLDTLSRLLYFSAGVIRKAVLRMAGEVHYRAAASAGALYPIEAYLVCRDLPGLEAGVYHFAPAEFSLRRLRAAITRSTDNCRVGELLGAYSELHLLMCDDGRWGGRRTGRTPSG